MDTNKTYKELLVIAGNVKYKRSLSNINKIIIEHIDQSLGYSTRTFHNDIKIFGR